MTGGTAGIGPGSIRAAHHAPRAGNTVKVFAVIATPLHPAGRKGAVPDVRYSMVTYGASLSAASCAMRNRILVFENHG